MMEFSEKGFKAFMEDYTDIGARAREIAESIAHGRNITDFVKYYSEFSIDNDDFSITFEYDESHFGDCETSRLVFPISYLWDDNYLQIEEEMRNKRMIEKEKIEKFLAEAAEKQEMEEYLKLKKKYGG